MPKHKFPLPEARFLVVGDGPLEFFVTRAQAERHVDAGGRWAGKVHCHNSGELRLVDSEGKCEHCRAGGQCEPCWAKVIERLDPVERFHNEQLESVLRPIPLEVRLRLYARIWNEAIINFITAVRIECAPPMGTMPDGAIRAGVVFGPPPRPGDVRNLDWIKRLPRNGNGGIPDADVILRDLTKRAVTAKAKLIHCLNNAFEEEPWTRVRSRRRGRKR